MQVADGVGGEAQEGQIGEGRQGPQIANAVVAEGERGQGGDGRQGAQVAKPGIGGVVIVVEVQRR